MTHYYPEGLSPFDEATTEAIFGASLSEEQKQKVAKLQMFFDSLPLASTPPLYRAASKHTPTTFFAKFLSARKWNVENAKKMLEGSGKFRVERKLDVDPLFPTHSCVRGYPHDELIDFQGAGRREPGFADKLSAVTKRAYSGAWHKWDKEGRPVFIERTGQSNPKRLVALSRSAVPPGSDITQPCVDVHIHNNEVGGVLLRWADAHRRAKEGPHLVQVSAIMDCSGLTMQHLFGPAMDIMKAQTQMDQEFYPEGLHRLYVANAPMMIRFAWALVRTWVDSRTHRKVVFLKPNETKRRLLEDFNAEDLPEFLGGTCRCDGACVPEIPTEGEGNEMPSEWDGETTEEIVVQRQRKVTKEVTGELNDCMCWEYNTRDKDIVVAVEFFANDGRPPLVACQPLRASSGAGTYILPASGRLVITLDNEYSWMNSKTVDFRVSKAVGDKSMMFSLPSPDHMQAMRSDFPSLSSPLRSQDGENSDDLPSHDNSSYPADGSSYPLLPTDEGS